MSRNKDERIKKLREIFLAAHREYERVNNPVGRASGEFARAWDARTEALFKLVRAQNKA